MIRASYRRAIAAISSAIAAAACVDSKPLARTDDARSDSVSAVANQPTHVSSDAAPSSDSAGARTFTWSLSALELRLRAEGIKPVATGEVKQPFIGGPGMRYRLIGGELQAFIYADAGAVARDVDQLDTVKVAPPTTMISWVMPPKLIVSNNLVLIVLTSDGALRKKIRAAVSVERPSHTKNY